MYWWYKYILHYFLEQDYGSHFCFVSIYLFWSFFAKSVEIYAESLTEMFTIDAHTLLNERLIFAKFILLNLQKNHLIYVEIIKAV